MTFKEFLVLYNQGIIDYSSNEEIGKISQEIAAFFRDPVVRDQILKHEVLFGKIRDTVLSFSVETPPQNPCVNPAIIFSLIRSYSEDPEPQNFFFSPIIIFYVFQNEDKKISMYALRELIENASAHPEELKFLLENYSFFYNKTASDNLYEPLQTFFSDIVSACLKYSANKTDLAEILLNITLSDDLFAALSNNEKLLKCLFPSGQTLERHWWIFNALLLKVKSLELKAKLVVACPQAALKREFLGSLKEELCEKGYYFAYWKLSKQDNQAKDYVIRKFIEHGQYDDIEKIEKLELIAIIRIKLSQNAPLKNQEKFLRYVWKCPVADLESLSESEARKLSSLLYDITPPEAGTRWNVDYTHRYFLICKLANIDLEKHIRRIFNEGYFLISRPEFYLENSENESEFCKGSKGAIKVVHELNIYMAIMYNNFDVVEALKKIIPFEESDIIKCGAYLIFELIVKNSPVPAKVFSYYKSVSGLSLIFNEIENRFLNNAFPHSLLMNACRVMLRIIKETGYDHGLMAKWFNFLSCLSITREDMLKNHMEDPLLQYYEGYRQVCAGEFKASEQWFQKVIRECTGGNLKDCFNVKRMANLQLGELYFQGRLEDEKNPDDGVMRAIKAFEFLREDKEWLSKIIFTLNETPWQDTDTVPKLNISLKNFYCFCDYYITKSPKMIEELLKLEGFIKKSDLIFLSFAQRKSLREGISAISSGCAKKAVIIDSLDKQIQTFFRGEDEASNRRLDRLGIDAPRTCVEKTPKLYQSGSSNM